MPHPHLGAAVATDIRELKDHGHAVQFYEDDAFLGEVVVRYLYEGLVRGDACIVIATEPHRRRFCAGLDTMGMNAASLEHVGQLVLLDAHDTLATFMIDGHPDARRFEATIAPALDRCRANATSNRVRAYGEMVDVLWSEGQGPAALELEALWNGLADAHAFALLCAYSLSRFHSESHALGLAAVCDAHTHVVPDLACAVDERDDQRREIVRLQQRARALESEIARRDVLERELASREAELRDFVDNAVIGMHWVGPDGLILWANRAELDLLGYTHDEFVGHNISEFHLDAPVIDEIMARLARNEKLEDFPARLRRKNGSSCHVLVDSNVRWRDGEFVHTRCFTRDVTAAERAHDALTRLHVVTQLLSAASSLDEVLDVLIGAGLQATNASGGAIFLVDHDASVLEVLRSRGYADAAIERHRHLPLATRTPVTDCVRDGRAIYIESGTGPYDDRNADVFALGSEARAAIPMFASGRPVGAMKFSFDAQHVFDEGERLFLDALARQGAQALERARLYESERAARQAAETAVKRKDEFLALLGHELRNPLAPIRTALEVMRLRGVAGIREHDVIDRQVNHLSRLVDDLLDVSRIATGKVQLEKKPIEIGDVVAKAVEMATPLLEQRSHRLTLEVPRTGLRVSADGFRLAQVVSNLLTNAAKYTDPGGHIEVRASTEADQVVVTVRDNGIGIHSELLPHVFELFVQGARSIARKHGGLGLGLALARNLTTLHGGTIEARSEGPGRGSELVVRLPALLAADEAPAPRPSRPVTTCSMRVLVVDDNEDAAILVADALAARGHDVSVAHDGPDALAKAAQFKPDAAFIDIGLPVMSGFEVATRLRQLLAAPIRLVAVTGYGQESDRAQARAAGFDDHLVKPVPLEALIASLSAPRFAG